MDANGGVSTRDAPQSDAGSQAARIDIQISATIAEATAVRRTAPASCCVRNAIGECRINSESCTRPTEAKPGVRNPPCARSWPNSTADQQSAAIAVATEV